VNKELNRDLIEKAYIEVNPIISDEEYDLIYGNKKLKNSLLSMEALYGISNFEKYIES
jgi:aminoglycoside phosphotransferase family enzyme